MTKSDKTALIEELKDKFSQHEYFYFADASTMTVAQVNDLRRKLFESGIRMKIYKNTLVRKALESVVETTENTAYENLYDTLVGNTAIMFTETGNAPAKVLKEFRKESERPLLKAAYIDSSVFKGDDQIDTLASLKSKDDLIGDVILLLQSPIKTVLGGLQSGGNTLSGLLKALEERGEAAA